MKAKRIGDLQTVENKNAHRLAAKEYKHLRVQLENGEEIHILLTEKELNRAIERAKKNPEDLPKVGFFQNLLD